MGAYRHRIADDLLRDNLEASVLVLIEGTKWCGNPDGSFLKIDTDRMNAPAFLMVLTVTGQYAYKRKDDICVVPIGCLGP